LEPFTHDFFLIVLIYLVLEKRKGDHSFFYPYIATLPDFAIFDLFERKDYDEIIHENQTITSKELIFEQVWGYYQMLANAIPKGLEIAEYFFFPKNKFKDFQKMK